MKKRQALTEEQKQKAEALWLEGKPASEVAASVGWTTRQLQGAKEAKELSLPRRQQGVGRKHQSSRDLTKRELQAATARVRETWSEFERLNRKVGSGRVLPEKEIKEFTVRHPRTFYMQFFEGVVNG